MIWGLTISSPLSPRKESKRKKNNSACYSLRASSPFGFHARFIWVSREICVRAARGLGRGRGRESLPHDWRLFISISPGRSEIPLAETGIHQSIFAANVEMCWIAFLEVGTCENKALVNWNPHPPPGPGTDRGIIGAYKHFWSEICAPVVVDEICFAC